jgi:hypothetical protein
MAGEDGGWVLGLELVLGLLLVLGLARVRAAGLGQEAAVRGRVLPSPT